MNFTKMNFIIGILGLIIFIFLFNLGLRLTGYATTTDTALINITVNPQVSINFTVDNINFGSGRVNIGEDNATINTLGNVARGNWTPTFDRFMIENIGNSNISLYLKSGKTAAGFLGGTNPVYQYNDSNFESGSCTAGDIILGTWNNVNTSGDGDKICNIFNYNLNTDSITVDLRLTIPSDALLGAQTDTFTATGSAI